MGTLVTYAREGSIASATMDDGKVNVLSVSMLAEIAAALDRAEADGAVLVLSGRPGAFSAGFDLGTLRGGGSDAATMLRAGFDLAERMLSFPRPLVIACTGHAVAMAVFLLLSGDYRVGAAGPYKIQANEVAIGLPMPVTAVEISRQRLTPAAFNRAVILAEPFAPNDDAVAAGFLDRVVPADDVADVARTTAETLATLDRDALAATKLRAREQALAAIRAGMQADDAGFRA